MLIYLPVFLYYMKIFFDIFWSQHYTVSSELPSCILPTFLWYSKDKPIYFKHFSNNYDIQLFYDMGNTKEWVNFFFTKKLKHEFNLNNNLYFNWMQLIHSIPQKWKNVIKNNRIPENQRYLNHHLKNVIFYLV